MADTAVKDRLVRILGRHYVIAHRALAYYGKWTGELNATGYANLRDALSHLRRFFDPKPGDIDPSEQLTCAAEHVRRAATEAYQECFELYYAHARSLYRRYRDECIHEEHALGYYGMYDHSDISKELGRLGQKLKECRQGKDGTDLEPLVMQLIPACERVRALSESIEACWNEYNERKGNEPLEPWV